jgi:hypothetical protein
MRSAYDGSTQYWFNVLAMDITCVFNDYAFVLVYDILYQVLPASVLSATVPAVNSCKWLTVSEMNDADARTGLSRKWPSA